MMLDIPETPAAPQPRAKPPWVTAVSRARWPLTADRARRTPVITGIRAPDLTIQEYLDPWRKTREGRSWTEVGLMQRTLLMS